MKKDLQELKKEYSAQALRKVEEGKGFTWSDKELKDKVEVYLSLDKKHRPCSAILGVKVDQGVFLYFVDFVLGKFPKLQQDNYLIQGSSSVEVWVANNPKDPDIQDIFRNFEKVY